MFYQWVRHPVKDIDDEQLKINPHNKEKQENWA